MTITYISLSAYPFIPTSSSCNLTIAILHTHLKNHPAPYIPDEFKNKLSQTTPL